MVLLERGHAVLFRYRAGCFHTALAATTAHTRPAKPVIQSGLLQKTFAIRRSNQTRREPSFCVSRFRNKKSFPRTLWQTLPGVPGPRIPVFMLNPSTGRGN